MRSEEALDPMVQRLLRAPYVVLDVETDGLDTTNNSVIWVGLAAPGQRHVIPLGHPLGFCTEPAHVIEEDDLSTVRPFKNNPTRFTKPKKKRVKIPAKFSEPPVDQLRPDIVFAALKPLLFDPERIIVGHNVKFDLLSVAKYYGGQIPTAHPHDTMILAHILNENQAAYDLKTLTTNWLLGPKATPERKAEFYPALAKGGIMDKPFDAIAEYLCRDITYTMWLYRRYMKRLTPKFRDVFELESDTQQVIMEMEQVGVRVDLSVIRNLTTKVAQERDALIQSIYDEAGREFNIASVPEKVALLFGSKDEGGMGLEPVSFTKKNQPQVNKAVMQALADDGVDIAEMLMEYGELDKILNSFLVPYEEEFVNPTTHRVHPSFWQHRARTARLTSSEPNIQQIPVRTELGRMFRRSFTAPPGGVLVTVDYDQIELRCTAHLSRDKAMRTIFILGEDIHARSAANAFTISIEKVTPEQRANGKTFSFAVLYGASPKKVAKTIGRPIKTTEKLLEEFYKGFPALERWKREVLASAVRKGDPNIRGADPYVEIPPYGRRRRLPDLWSGDTSELWRAQRQAVNAVVQGFASCIMKEAMVLTADELRRSGLAARIVVQVHDEVVVEVDNVCDAEAVLALVVKCMESITDQHGDPILGDVPLIASGGFGPTWVDAKDH